MRVLLVAITMFVALGGCAATAHRETSAPIVVYSGPNMRTSLETLALRFESGTGIHVVIVADDIRPLIARIVRERESDHRVPDLFVTHDPFLYTLVNQGIRVRESRVVASLVPVLVVAKGNPKGIHDLRDLAKPSVRVGLTDAEQTISGEIMKVMFRRAGIEQTVYQNATVRTSQGRDLCKALIAGKCDTGIVWKAVLRTNEDEVDEIPISDEYRPHRGVDSVVQHPTLGRLELDYVRVNVALLEDAPAPESARRFTEYLRSTEGAAVFAANGFSPVDASRSR